MTMNRRDFSASFLGAGLAASAWLAPSGASAQAGGEPVEGRDFAKLSPPQPGATPGKIEVLEFFSYACPHCNAFEPQLEAWAKTLPADVALRRVPVPFLMNAENFEHA